MGKVQRLVRNPPRSPERTTLAAAIERHRQAKSRVAELRAAKQTAERRLWTERRDLEHAEAALPKAEAADAQAVINAALGNDAPAPTLPAARRVLEDAKDRVSATRQARDLLGQQITEAESEIAYAEMNLKSALGEYLASTLALQNLVSEHAKLRARLGDVHAALKAVWGAGGLPAEKCWYDHPRLGDAGVLMRRWEQAIAAVREHADAPLPD